MDSRRFRWIGGHWVYIPSREYRPGDRVRVRDPKSGKLKHEAVVKLRDKARLLLSVRHGAVSFLAVVRWSEAVLLDDLIEDRELAGTYAVIGGVA